MISVVNGQLVQTAETPSATTTTPISSAELQRQHDEIEAAIKNLQASLSLLKSDIKEAERLEKELEDMADGSGKVGKK